MPRGASLLLPALVAFGLWSEWVAFGGELPRRWVPDLLTGLTFIGTGFVAWHRRPDSRVGLLLVATGACWFMGNLASSFAAMGSLNPAIVTALATAVVASYQAPLAHALISYPDGRLTTPLQIGVTGIVYATVSSWRMWPVEPATSFLFALVAGAGGISYRRTRGHQRRARLLASQVATMVVVALAVGLVLRRGVPSTTGAELALLVYELAVAGSAVLLAAGLVRSGSARAAVADIVVEVGEDRSGTLRDALANVLGDPSLQIAYRIGTQGAFVDAAGRPFDLPDRSVGRALTRIERDGEMVAVLVHDPAVLDDPALVDAVASAARLASRNAELQAASQGQLTELRASRRRLVGAGDAERRRLAQRLDGGALGRLDDLSTALDTIISGSDPSHESSRRMLRAREHALTTMEMLHDLAKGLHPSDLREGGLGPALRRLTTHVGVPVDLTITDARLPPEIEAGIYFLCAEGLANVTKHARASRVRLVVGLRGANVAVDLTDDGVGGADVRRGSGLRGLADRIDVLGGSLTVDSQVGWGTRLIAEIPLGGSA